MLRVEVALVAFVAGGAGRGLAVASQPALNVCPGITVTKH